MPGPTRSCCCWRACTSSAPPARCRCGRPAAAAAPRDRRPARRLGHAPGACHAVPAHDRRARRADDRRLGDARLPAEVAGHRRSLGTGPGLLRFFAVFYGGVQVLSFFAQAGSGRVLAAARYRRHDPRAAGGGVGCRRGSGARVAGWPCHRGRARASNRCCAGRSSAAATSCCSCRWTPTSGVASRRCSTSPATAPAKRPAPASCSCCWLAGWLVSGEPAGVVLALEAAVVLARPPARSAVPRRRRAAAPEAIATRRRSAWCPKRAGRSCRCRPIRPTTRRRERRCRSPPPRTGRRRRSIPSARAAGRPAVRRRDACEAALARTATLRARPRRADHRPAGLGRRRCRRRGRRSKQSRRALGMLIDALLEPETDFAIRRRLPRILGTVATGTKPRRRGQRPRRCALRGALSLQPRHRSDARQERQALGRSRAHDRGRRARAVGAAAGLAGLSSARSARSSKTTARTSEPPERSTVDGTSNTCSRCSRRSCRASRSTPRCTASARRTPACRAWRSSTSTGAAAPSRVALERGCGRSMMAATPSPLPSAPSQSRRATPSHQATDRQDHVDAGKRRVVSPTTCPRHDEAGRRRRRPCA